MSERTRVRWLITACLGLASMACGAVPARATSPYLEAPAKEEVASSPAYRYANMTNEQAFAELDRRGVPYEKVGPHGTTRAPIRLTGKLHGVDIHGALPPEQRKDSFFEVLDARFALSLDDFCVVLEKHDVVEVIHYSMYRPNVPAPDSPALAQKATGSTSKSRKSGSHKAKRRAQLKGKAAKADKRESRASSGTKKPALVSRDAYHAHAKWAPPGTRHPAGLAIDLATLKKKDGTVLSVGPHFHGKIGDKTCGAGAALGDSDASRELHAIVCEARDGAIFTYALTPNYDADHADHFHLEIKPGVAWFLYQ